MVSDQNFGEKIFIFLQKDHHQNDGIGVIVKERNLSANDQTKTLNTKSKADYDGTG